MPVYDYHCSACDADFERSRSVDDRDHPIACPSCRQPSQRAFSPSTSFALRGDGWAKDGYGRPATGADMRAGRLKPKDLEKIPYVDREGKLRDATTNKVMAG